MFVGGVGGGLKAPFTSSDAVKDALGPIRRRIASGESHWSGPVFAYLPRILIKRGSGTLNVLNRRVAVRCETCGTTPLSG